MIFGVSMGFLLDWGADVWFVRFRSITLCCNYALCWKGWNAGLCPSDHQSKNASVRAQAGMIKAAIVGFDCAASGFYFSAGQELTTEVCDKN